MDNELRYFLEQGPTTTKELARLTGKSDSGIRKTLQKHTATVMCKKNDAGANVFWLEPNKADKSAVEAPLASPEAKVGATPSESPDVAPATSPGRRGRKPTAYGQKLFATGDENPRRAGTHGHKSMAVIIAKPGLTTEQFVTAGGRLVDLRWDLNLGNVRTEGGAA